MTILTFVATGLVLGLVLVLIVVGFGAYVVAALMAEGDPPTLTR
jgi:hypothetical protein